MEASQHNDGKVVVVEVDVVDVVLVAVVRRLQSRWQADMYAYVLNCCIVQCIYYSVHTLHLHLGAKVFTPL